MIRTAAMTAKPPKPRTCRNKACSDKFAPVRAMQVACSVGCAIILSKEKIRADTEKAAKLDRAETKQKLDAIKPRAKWLAEAQAAFNAFIRERDAALPCISCGRFHQGAHDAGHYRSVGAMPSLRFHEDNCHRQCVPCNQHKAGNVIEYRIRLIERIGADRLAFLEGPHAPVKHTIDDAKAIKALYRAKHKALLIARHKEAA